MADPRLYQTFKCQASTAENQSAVRNFGNAVGKIGDLQVLNSIGAGKIGQGLRTIASISNTIRTGCGSLPTAIGQSIETGANWVLENTGIAPSVVKAVADFNPAIANQAYGQAKAIYEQAKQGKFKVTDIPNVLQDLQNLERLGRNIFTPSNVQDVIALDCTTSPYAVDLIMRAPKHKFMFIVQVVFNPGYALLDEIDFAFVIKKSTRPNIKFQMEDVNYYNFRSKVITKTEFEEMSMTFHDDNTNQVIRFCEAYRRAMSPISNLSEATFFTMPEQSGMDFTDASSSNVFSTKNPIENNILSGHYSASRGPLLNDNTNVIKSIRLYHVYESGTLVNMYQFLNPRITAINMDDVDMSVGTEGNEATINFNYDSVYVETDIPAEDIVSGSVFPGQSRGVLYPLRYNGTAQAINDRSIPSPVNPVNNSPSCDPLNKTNTSTNPFISGGGIGGALNSITNSNLNSIGNVISDIFD